MSNYTDAERADFRSLSNQWSMWGIDCIKKLGRKWALPDAAKHPTTFRTKREAYTALTALVLERSRRIQEGDAIAKATGKAEVAK